MFLLSGGLEDILKGTGNPNDSDDEDDIGGIRSFIVRGNNLESTNKKEDDNGLLDEDDDDEDEEDDDDDDDEDDEDNDHELDDKKVIDVVSVSPLGGLPINKKIISIGPKVMNDKGSISTVQQNQNQNPKDDEKCSIRQNCIATIRRLSKEGNISTNQKTVLITDIITKSSSGEFSLVEVAYDLLITEGDDIIAAEDDFADQCRVFATRLEKESQ